VVYGPEWWRDRLVAKLRERSARCHAFFEFFEGTQPLAFASDRFQQEFGRRYAHLPANFMPLVVDAEAERLVVQGFRFGRNESDKGVWRLWQDNQLDAESQIAHEIALVKGVAYGLVDPNGGRPVITIEDPEEMVVETAPGNRRLRHAALKVWHDDDGHLRATLYLPAEIYKWRSRTRRERADAWSWDQVAWEPFVPEGEDWPGINPLGVVPVVPLLNRPRRDGTGRSEIAPVMGNQSAINKVRFDALVASEFVAFPQRWATNIDIPVDPATGQAIAPFRPGVDMLWVTRKPKADEVDEYAGNVPQPAFGQFPAADLRPYIELIREEIAQMASISRTPYHYLLGDPKSVPPSGESIKSSEAPLVKKVGRQAVHFGEGWEELMRVALIASNQPTKARTDGETIWADPETRNEGARTDAIMKQYEQGLLPDDVALEELGYSQQQIERIRSLKATQSPAPPAPADGVQEPAA